jgi:hypothetical protein
LISIKEINPIALANRTSIHPKAMMYKRKVMRFLMPELRSPRFGFHHSGCPASGHLRLRHKLRHSIAELANAIKD